MMTTAHCWNIYQHNRHHSNGAICLSASKSRGERLLELVELFTLAVELGDRKFRNLVARLTFTLLQPVGGAGDDGIRSKESEGETAAGPEGNMPSDHLQQGVPDATASLSPYIAAINILFARISATSPANGSRYRAMVCGLLVQLAPTVLRAANIGNGLCVEAYKGLWEATLQMAERGEGLRPEAGVEGYLEAVGDEVANGHDTAT
ncbi:hypothetical protein LTR85_009754 [Meristemomyces frigidus]|nr:hypothetical protein LTR85_009754 [Meristemomyces frigidus]